METNQVIGRRRVVVWVHPQPEAYFNRMIDALEDAGVTHGTEYRVVFLRGNPGTLENPLPERAASRILKIRPGREKDVFHPFRAVHADWMGEFFENGVPDAVVVAGYNTRTLRGVLKECSTRGIPVGMFSDSNLRGERGRSFKKVLKRRVKRWVLKGVIAKVDTLLTANRLGVAYWRYYGAPRNKILRCPYYADYQRVMLSMGTRREEVLGKRGLPASGKLIVTAARLVPVKGLELMMKAFKAARLGEKGWTWALAGTGPLEAKLKAMAGEELGKSIDFLGFVQPSELLPVIRHADLFVLPSVYEPHGIVVQAVLAAGTPVIASSVCGAAFDLVKAGVNGWIFRSGDADDLRKKLEEAAGHAGWLADMRPAAQEIFKEWYAQTNPVKVIDAWARGVMRAKGGVG